MYCTTCMGRGLIQDDMYHPANVCIHCKGSGIEKDIASETQKTINEWASKTFGYPTPEAAVKRMLKEVEELKEVKLSEMSAEDVHKAMVECADIFIVMCVVADSLGCNLQDYIDNKMEINRARKWKMNGDGTGQHIKE